MTSKAGYMLFAAEAPIVGLDPHPAYAPCGETIARNVDGWFGVYGVFADIDEARREAQSDHEARLEAFEDGDIEDVDDPDFVLPVDVDDAGTVKVWDEGRTFLMAEWAPADIYRAFGMSLPSEAMPVTTRKEVGAQVWALVREQIDALAAVMRAHGIAAVKASFANEDPDAGLQPLEFIGDDGAPLDLPDIEIGAACSIGIQDLGQGDARVFLREIPQATIEDVFEATFENIFEYSMEFSEAEVVDHMSAILLRDGSVNIEITGAVAVVRAVAFEDLEPETSETEMSPCV